MKALPWILVLAGLAGTGFFFKANKKSEVELSRLRQENVALAETQTALAAKASEAQNGDAILSAADRQELIRLRNEVGVLRRDKQQLTTQAQRAQENNERLLQSQQEQRAQLQQQNQQVAQLTQKDQNEKALDACINNLRQIDGAMQQWALEYKQPAEAPVTLQQVAPYLGTGGGKIPVCPSGGTYTLVNVATPPTCSIAGHALPP